MRRIVFALLGLLLIARACRCRDEDAPPLRIATFNIENFPKHDRQVAGAFDEIARLDAPIVAVQEITDADAFAAAARRRLGTRWRFESIETGSVLGHRLGVLYDGGRVRHVKTRVHDGTRLDGRYKPVLDVELASGGARVRVLVVHLKAGGENHPVRRRQYAALARIVADVKRAGTPVVLLGDFNATGEADRDDLARVDLHWLTEGLGCTAFWDQLDQGCPRSRLDHVLSTRRATLVRAAGGCAADGCGWQDRCPLYAAEVSDHCPVLVELAPP